MPAQLSRRAAPSRPEAPGARSGSVDPSVLGDLADVAAAVAEQHEDWFWLDGERAAAGEPRVSYLGIASETRIAEPGDELGFLEGLRSALGPHAGGAGRPPGFSEGWIIVLGYEFGVALLGCDPKPDVEPPAFAMRAAAVLIVDHDAGTAELRDSTDGALGAAIRAAGVSDAALDGTSAGGSARPAASRRADGSRRPEENGRNDPVDANHPRDATGTAIATATATGTAIGTATGTESSDADYLAGIAACQQAIHAGDAYVLCLTDTVERTTRQSPLETYTRLRGRAIRGGVVQVGQRALVSFSPERFLSTDGRRISTHPIKGTRPRGATPAADRDLAEQLAADPKERAENLMIVDLMRNDLSRVCLPGTVGVEGFLRVETHPNVHQLVSTVSGDLDPGRDVIDAILACFPGGSMTGAPKRRAVEILGALERGPRGLYSGCFGWIDRSGAAELAMTIRSIEFRGIESAGADDRGIESAGADDRGIESAGADDRGIESAGADDGGSGSQTGARADAGSRPAARVRIGAGGGITADSDPESELAEKALKAAPLLAVLGATPSDPA